MASPIFTIAIESAVAGGSLSLLRGDEQLAEWIGSADVSKAEDLLFNIDELLARQHVKKNEIGLIACSAGPGSFTGIRIGLATAIGLKAGLGIEMASSSVLKAVAATADMPSGIVHVALPVGRSAVCVQSFRYEDGKCIENTEAASISEQQFSELIHDGADKIFLIHDRLFSMLEPSDNIINIGSNLARLIGQFCRNEPGTAEPIFLSKGF